MQPSDDELTEAGHIQRMPRAKRARAFAMGREAAVARMLGDGLRVEAARDWAELREQRMRDIVAALDLATGRVSPGSLNAR